MTLPAGALSAQAYTSPLRYPPDLLHLIWEWPARTLIASRRGCKKAWTASCSVRPGIEGGLVLASERQVHPDGYQAGHCVEVHTLPLAGVPTPQEVGPADAHLTLRD